MIEKIISDPKVLNLEKFILKNKFKILWLRITHTPFYVKVKVIKGMDPLKYENVLVKVINPSKYLSKTKDYLGTVTTKFNKNIEWKKLKTGDKILVSHLSLIDKNSVKTEIDNLIRLTNKNIENSKLYIERYTNELKALEEINLKITG